MKLEYDYAQGTWNASTNNGEWEAEGSTPDSAVANLCAILESQV